MRLGWGEKPPAWLHVFFSLDPLLLVSTWLSTYQAPLLLGLVTLVSAPLLGRFFCGWICPFGALHALFTRMRHWHRKPKNSQNEYTHWQRAKYLVLIAFLAMSAFGMHWVGVLDPFSVFYRSTAMFILPGAQYGVEEGATTIYQADPAVGPLHLTTVTEPAYQFLRKHVFSSPRQNFLGAAVIAGVFLAAVALNFYRRRFWCRYVCPLGALLGLLSKRQAYRLVSDKEKCTGCGLCAMKCPAAATPEKPGEWRPTECFGCWNCVDSCRTGALDFKLVSPFQSPTTAKLNLSRRRVIAAAAGGTAGLVMCRVAPQAQGKAYNPALIRPPGARAEREFLQRCMQCGICMKACPTNALQPTLLEAGLEGIWTPRVVPNIGYCEYNCNLCGQVCPEEAIEPLKMEDKQKVKIGLAAFDTTRCLPYAYDRECMVCEEHCPLPKKAIFFREKQITTRDGKVVTVKQPYVDPELCIGCGVCENKCVFSDLPAIRVTSANETRHPDNQPILQGFGGDSYFQTPVIETSAPAPASTPPQSADPAASSPYGQ